MHVPQTKVERWSRKAAGFRECELGSFGNFLSHLGHCCRAHYIGRAFFLAVRLTSPTCADKNQRGNHSQAMAPRLFSSKPTWLNGLVISRVLVGILIAKYGSVIFDGNQMIKEVDYFGSHLGLPAPLLMVYLAKGTEFFGGLLLALGLFTRGATLLLIINMTVATFFANRGAIFGDSEKSFLCLLFFLTSFFVGASRWSLDHWLFDRNKL